MMKYKRIIIVDDNETALFLNTDIVEECFGDVQIVTFSNSQEFIDGCLAHEEWVDESTLVLLDINMPGKYGFDVLDELEEEFDDMENMQVIMVTSSTLKRDKECAERYSCMIGYVVKPLEATELLKVIEGSDNLFDNPF